MNFFERKIDNSYKATKTLEYVHMNRLSFIEIVALAFAAMAGLASAVQAYVSWETRGEVSRAIVFAERIDACANALAAIDPFVEKAKPEARKIVASGPVDGRYSLPSYFYKTSSGNAAFNSKHNPRIEKWRVASAAFSIVHPQGSNKVLDFINTSINKDIPEGRYMSQKEMLTWLEELEKNSNNLKKTCRNLL